jgi:hypothetical protein
MHEDEERMNKKALSHVSCLTPVDEQSHVETARVLQKDPSAVRHLLRQASLDRENPWVQRILAKVSATGMVICA